MSLSPSRAVQECIWIMATIVTLMSLASQSRVYATVICSECWPLSLQEAPAVGMSLAPGYGSVSIQFGNGTILDVAAVNGTEAYLRAMKHWQYLEMNPVVVEDRHKPETRMPLLSFERLRSWLKIESQTPIPPPSEPIYHEFIPIAEMMSILYEKANTSVPLIHNKVYLGIPDVENTESLDGPRVFRPLLNLAGLDYLRYRRQSRLSTLYLYGLDDCFGIWLDEFTEIPDTECEKYRGRLIQSVLYIHLDEFSLNLRFLVREDGLFPDNLGSPQLLWVDDGLEPDNKTYWDWLESSLRDFLRKNEVAFDLVSLSGSQVTAPNFQLVVQDLFKDHEKITPQDYLRGANDHVFASARAAARLARIGMCTGYAGCMPTSWCPISEYCKEREWYKEDEAVKKTEL